MARAAWRDALDAKMRLMSYFRTNMFSQSHALIGLDNDDYVRRMEQYYRGIASSVEPIWLAENIGNGLLNNMCDENTVFDMQSMDIPKEGLVWLEHPLTHVVQGPNQQIVRTVLRGMMYGILTEKNETYMLVCVWQQTGTGLNPVIIRAIKSGWNIEDWIIEQAISMERGHIPPLINGKLEKMGFYDVDNSIDTLESVRSMYGFIMRYLYTLFSFMEQRIVAASHESIDRKGQKEAARLNIPSDVRVLRWRLKKYERLETETQQIDWSCHWSVKEHTRHYKSGKVVTIPSYVKGDRTKPYKPPTLPINVVDR